MSARFLPRESFAELIEVLRDGRRLLGPRVRDGAITWGELERVDDLPLGVGDEQSPGRYRLRDRGDTRAFGYAVEGAEAILKICAEIDKLESEADHVMRSAIARLFREEDDVKNLIKLRSIYELLEAVTDACEDVANLIEGIVVENA